MSSRRVDLYGIKEMTLEDARQLVERILGIKLVEEEGSDYGDVSYRHRLGPGKEVRLFSNYDANKEEWKNENAKDYWILLNLSDIEDMDAIKDRLIDASEAIDLLGTSEINTD